MTNTEAKEVVIEIFKKLKAVSSINDIEKIFEDHEVLQKNRMSEDLYPAINYSLSEAEIFQLKKDEINYTFYVDKLLFALGKAVKVTGKN
jgi:hypothetical protein